MTATSASIAEQRTPDGVLRWTLCNEARRNAIDPAGLRWMAERCTSLQGDIVVLSGAGERGFCAGFDLTALHTGGASLPDDPLIEAAAAMSRADATFVAAIGGYAIGAGVELCCACDFRIASDDATFSIPAARLGVVYHAEGLARIRAVFGPTVTRELLLLGRKVSAPRAAQAGALLDVVPRSELHNTTDVVVAELAAGDPDSIRGNRNFLRTLDAEGPDDTTLGAHQALRERVYKKLS